MINVSKQTYSLKALWQEKKKEKLFLHSLNPLFSPGIEPATEERGKLLFKESPNPAIQDNEHGLLQPPLLKAGAMEEAQLSALSSVKLGGRTVRCCW